MMFFPGSLLKKSAQNTRHATLLETVLYVIAEHLMALRPWSKQCLPGTNRPASCRHCMTCTSSRDAKSVVGIARHANMECNAPPPKRPDLVPSRCQGNNRSAARAALHILLLRQTVLLIAPMMKPPPPPTVGKTRQHSRGRLSATPGAKNLTLRVENRESSRKSWRGKSENCSGEGIQGKLL